MKKVKTPSRLKPFDKARDRQRGEGFFNGIIDSSGFINLIKDEPVLNSKSKEVKREASLHKSKKTKE